MREILQVHVSAALEIGTRPSARIGPPRSKETFDEDAVVVQVGIAVAVQVAEYATDRLNGAGVAYLAVLPGSIARVIRSVEVAVPIDRQGAQLRDVAVGLLIPLRGRDLFATLVSLLIASIELAATGG